MGKREDLIAAHRRKAAQLEDPLIVRRHEDWLRENKEINRRDPHKEKPVSRATIDSIHEWAAEHLYGGTDGQERIDGELSPGV